MKEGEHLLVHSTNKKKRQVLLEIDIRFINDLLDCINDKLQQLEINRPYEESERIIRLKKYRDDLISSSEKIT